MDTQKYQPRFLIKKGRQPSLNNVDYAILNQHQEAVYKPSNHACFAELVPTGYSPGLSHLQKALKTKEKRTIVVYKKRFNLVYADDFIEKYIKTIGKIGFPCQVQFPNNSRAHDMEAIYKFIIALDDYKYALQWFATLTLIRYLFESYVCWIPEAMFNIHLKNKPNPTKEEIFDALQSAHHSKAIQELCYLSAAHALMGSCTSANITLSQFQMDLEKKCSLLTYGNANPKATIRSNLNGLFRT